jgi:hypothetical protein
MGRCGAMEKPFPALANFQPDPEMTEDPAQDLKK